jgi:hypothetical protein
MDVGGNHVGSLDGLCRCAFFLNDTDSKCRGYQHLTVISTVTDGYDALSGKFFNETSFRFRLHCRR